MLVAAISRIGLSPPQSFASFTTKRSPFLCLSLGRSGSLLPIGTSTKLGIEPTGEVDPADLDVLEIEHRLEIGGDVDRHRVPALAGFGAVDSRKIRPALASYLTMGSQSPPDDGSVEKPKMLMGSLVLVPLSGQRRCHAGLIPVLDYLVRVRLCFRRY